TLLDLLLEEKENTNDESVQNIFAYISKLQEKIAQKKSKMKTLSLLAHASKLKKNSSKEITLNTTFADGTPTANRTDNIRKEPKEIINNLININIKNNFSKNEFSNDLYISPVIKQYHIPSVEEVKEFVSQYHFDVDPETFVDFYDSRNWCVGKSEIRNWKATVRMWHRRAEEKNQQTKTNNFDESYWHELKERFDLKTSPTPPKPPPKNTTNSISKTQQSAPPEMDSIFSRYMYSIEKNDF
ncbi:MAG: hypothetical protein IKW39_04620, partial [Alphaproteobacteria bacterium]|nr:hypothetical protein [Alphaproteobacteria bacterium]